MEDGYYLFTIADDSLKLIPVIVLTTSAEERDKVEAYKLNVAGYILKPVTLVNFIETMATLNQSVLHPPVQTSRQLCSAGIHSVAPFK